MTVIKYCSQVEYNNVRFKFKKPIKLQCSSDGNSICIKCKLFDINVESDTDESAGKLLCFYIYQMYYDFVLPNKSALSKSQIHKRDIINRYIESVYLIENDRNITGTNQEKVHMHMELEYYIFHDFGGNHQWNLNLQA